MNGPMVPVVGRDQEVETLTRLFKGLPRGESRSVVIIGDAGIGKTTILERFAATHASWQIKTSFGVESEMELAWAALHQLCASMLEYLPRIPTPQSEALKSAFGLGGDGIPEPFLCGLAVLSLLAEAAESGPVICVIDDAHALDRVSLATLGSCGHVRIENDRLELYVFAEVMARLEGGTIRPRLRTSENFATVERIDAELLQLRIQKFRLDDLHIRDNIDDAEFREHSRRLRDDIASATARPNRPGHRSVRGISCRRPRLDQMDTHSARTLPQSTD